MQIPSGVSAYIGSVTMAQMGYTLNLNEFFFKGIADGLPTVGDAWNFSIRQYFLSDRFAYKPEDISGMIWSFHQPWKYMRFGDPSLRIGGVPKPKS